MYTPLSVRLQIQLAIRILIRLQSINSFAVPRAYSLEISLPNDQPESTLETYETALGPFE
jgi:hypothetical protein